MSMALEEAIQYHAVEAVKLKLYKNVNEIILGTEGYEKALQEHIQTADWLLELQERRKQLEIIRCGECKHKKDHHYENPGEEPYIKSICENKYGLVKNYQVHDWDFCSRGRRTDE